jgi:hypothetical protein
MFAFCMYQLPTGKTEATPSRPTVMMPMAMRTSVREMPRGWGLGARGWGMGARSEEQVRSLSVVRGSDLQLTTDD